jgi:hypothetical protein
MSAQCKALCGKTYFYYEFVTSLSLRRCEYADLNWRDVMRANPGAEQVAHGFCAAD